MHINVIKNTSPCCSPALGKIFDSQSKQLVIEPGVIIDEKIDYRSMSIDVQLENGTIGERVDFSTFGSNKLDMADRISFVSSEINEVLDKQDLEQKKREEIENLINQ